VRGDEKYQEGFIMLSSGEDRVPPDHPLRTIRRTVDRALADMGPLFETLYAPGGRNSIPPEYLLRAQVLKVLYGIPSERRLCEHLTYNVLFRWFVGLPFSEEMWDHSTFTKNRDRLLSPEVTRVFFELIRGQAEARRLLSKEHFSVDGTLIEAAASLKSFRPKGEAAGEDGSDGPDGPTTGQGRNPTVDFHGERRSNETHASRTDPDARLARKGKGKEAKLSFQGHILVENRHGLIVDVEVTQATGTAEREAALVMLTRERGRRRGHMTVGADRGYNTKDFVKDTRLLKVTPHVAEKQKDNAIDGRTTTWEGYAISQRRRKIVEEPFGWLKTVGGLGKLLIRGLEKVTGEVNVAVAVYNLVRLKNLEAEPAPS
jgi:transposase